MSSKKNPNLDRALHISMGTSILGFFASSYFFSPFRSEFNLLEYLIILVGFMFLAFPAGFGLFIFVGSLAVIQNWFKRDDDRAWVLFLMPLTAFGFTFATMSAFWWFCRWLY